MTDSQKQIEELEKKANQIAQTMPSLEVGSFEFSCYQQGFYDGERLIAEKALSIIKQLQEEITQLKKLSGWRSKDILPEKEITHGILFDGGVPFQAWLVKEKNIAIWCRMPKNTVLEHVTDFTYWKPLDLPPHLIKGDNNDK